MLFPVWACLLFAGTHILFLQKLPIFNDEAIYLDWAKNIARNWESWRVPLIIDGKQPGYFVLLSVLLHLPFDPLLLGRLLSVCCAFGTAILTMLIAEKFFTKDAHAKQILLILLGITPFLVFFDRLALAEAPLTLLSMLALFFFLELRHHHTYQSAVCLGLVLGLGWWIKSTILLTFIPMMVVLCMDFFKATEKKGQLEKINYFLLTVTICAGLTVPFFSNHFVALVFKNDHQWTLTPAQLVALPIGVWFRNTINVLSLALVYLTPAGFLGFCVGAWAIVRKKHGWIFLAWIFAQVGVEIFLVTDITSRYLVPILPIALVITATGIAQCATKIRRSDQLALFFIALATVMLISAPLIFYRYASLLLFSKSDFGQYVTGWTSGYGVVEAINWLREHSAGREVMVLMRADSGNPESVLALNFAADTSIHLFSPPTFGLDVNQGTIRRLRAEHVPIYFVSRGAQFDAFNGMLHQEAKFSKPLDDEFIGIYTIDQSALKFDFNNN